MMQKYILADEGYAAFADYLHSLACKKALLVHGKSMLHLAVGQFLLHLPDALGIDVVEFTDFAPNPDIESAIAGADLCRRAGCDLIIACGGGSAMDVAKCIRLFREVDTSQDNFLQKLQPGKMPLIVIPTTAGTGSEATHFAVVYRDEKKLSVSEQDNIPQAVLWDADVLCSLPLKQKRAAYFDAFCHAIESYWSVNASDESRIYAAEALRLLAAAEKSYLDDKASTLADTLMMLAANYAGRAINISKTTAAHAMCYKLTSMLGLPHGQAAALCLDVLWPHMLKIARKNGFCDLQDNMEMIAAIWGEKDAASFSEKFHGMLCSHELIPKWTMLDKEQVIDALVKSVNIERLQNHPLKLGQTDFKTLYGQLFADDREEMSK